ncbi:TetR/AcrR family transcriptional regulator [Acidovorax sp.]|uniref:TetR/AcrR family transcriptional regulator n=1 Tax=Acidovorax sp. TaxID=1872122 RepID=UPI0025BD97F1|nr:TetR/AcrR family transcriptional regulator [Acidovorax sp.]
MPTALPPATSIAPPAFSPDLPARERILWTACALFYRDGVRATGIDRVIAEAGVTKVTFYRHFPSKNDLVLAFLADRHTRWMQWFDAALQRHGNTPDALVPALAEWLEDADFRGCAFLNTSAELGGSLDGVNTLTRQHKSDVARRIEALMPQAGKADLDTSPPPAALASMLCMAMDGAVTHTLFGTPPAQALAGLAQAVALLPAAPRRRRPAPAT